jgi:hypothetical protein
MRYALFIALLWVLCSCGQLQVLPVVMPAKPFYVVAGEDGAVGGFGQTKISLVDRSNWQVMGNRNLATTYIEDGTHDGKNIWLGLSRDSNEDKYIVSKISYNLAEQHDYITCMEPYALQRYKDSLLVACQENGFVAVVMRIRLSDGKVMAQRELRTKWGDMFLENSMLVGDELLVQGSSHAAQNIVAFEIQVLSADTLEWQRNLDQKQTISLRDSLVANGTTYIFNGTSAFPQENFLPFADVYTYHEGDTHFTPLPLIARNPQHGAIVGDVLYTVHNCWPANVADNQKILIYKTNLVTGESTHWEYDYDTWNRIGDMAAIDGHIMITRFWAHDSRDDGLYELDTTTGTLIQRANIEGATLIIDSTNP